MVRRMLLGLLVVAGSVSLLWAKPGVVKTNDGRTISGEVREDEKTGEVKIWTKGVQITLARDQVASIEYVADVQQEYQKRLAALGPKPSVRQLMELCRWLFDNREYDLALEVAERARKLEPANKDVADMISTIDVQKRMERTKPNPNDTPNVKPPTMPVKPPITPVKQPGAKNVLTPEQIQVIKRYELQETDNRVIVRFENGVEKRFIEFKRLNPREFMALNSFQKAVEIYREGLPEMHNDVKIMGDPAALAGFKSVQRTIATNCGAAGCHDGKHGGSFQLVLPSEGDPAIYSNFYILARYRSKVGGVEYKAVNRLQPAESLILQYGLPRDKARVPHPEVPGFRPVFANDQAPSYRALRNWIDSLRREDIDYGIDYNMPTTQPDRP